MCHACVTIYKNTKEVRCFNDSGKTNARSDSDSRCAYLLAGFLAAALIISAAVTSSLERG